MNTDGGVRKFQGIREEQKERRRILGWALVRGWVSVADRLPSRLKVNKRRFPTCRALTLKRDISG
jgi:hypothetical protein